MPPSSVSRRSTELFLGVDVNGATITAPTGGLINTFCSDRSVLDECVIKTVIQQFSGKLVLLDDSGDYINVAKQMGRDDFIHVDLRKTKESAINPIYISDIKDQTAETSEAAQRHAYLIADQISPVSPFLSNNQWQSGARELLAGLIAYVMLESPVPLRNLAEVHYLLKQNSRDFELLLEDMAKVKSPFIKQVAQTYMSFGSPLQDRLRYAAGGSAEVFGRRELAAPLSGNGALPFEKSIIFTVPDLPFELKATLLRVLFGTLMATASAAEASGSDISTLFLIPSTSTFSYFPGLRAFQPYTKFKRTTVWACWSSLIEMQRAYPHEYEAILSGGRALQLLDMESMTKATSDTLLKCCHQGLGGTGIPTSLEGLVRHQGATHRIRLPK